MRLLELLPDKFFREKKIRLFVSVLVSILFIYLTVREIDTEQIIPVIESYNLPVLGLAVVMILTGFYLQALRWEITIKGMMYRKRIRTFDAILIGNFYNSVLPLKMGEIIRLMYLSARHKISFSQAAITYFLDRIFDVLMILVSASILPVLIKDQNYFNWYLFIIPVVVLIVLFQLWKVLFIKKNILKIIVLPRKIKLQVLRLFIQVRMLRFCFSDKKILFGIVTYSFLLFFFHVVYFYLLLAASGLPPEFCNFRVAFFISLSAILVLIIPAGPSGIGVANYGVLQVFILYSEINNIEIVPVLKNDFIVFSFVYVITGFVADMLAGGLFFLLQKEDIKSITLMK